MFTDKDDKGIIYYTFRGVGVGDKNLRKSWIYCMEATKKKGISVCLNTNISTLLARQFWKLALCVWSSHKTYTTLSGHLLNIVPSLFWPVHSLTLHPFKDPLPCRWHWFINALRNLDSLKSTGILKYLRYSVTL